MIKQILFKKATLFYFNYSRSSVKILQGSKNSREMQLDFYSKNKGQVLNIASDTLRPWEGSCSPVSVALRGIRARPLPDGGQ